MGQDKSGAGQKKSFFAVTALRKNRWYWVVWPSLEMLAGNAEQHLAQGYESTKAEAVDRALEAAGMYGEWVAAKYAQTYHRNFVQAQQKGYSRGERAIFAPVVLEFLYRDMQAETTEQWYSVPHRVVKKTKKYIYVEQNPYNPEQLSGSWADYNIPTFRLSRQMLEDEGYALTPIGDIDDPLFFSAPYQERLIRYTQQPPDCLRRLNLTFPCTEIEVRSAYRKLAKQSHPDQGGDHNEFLALQAAYEQALRLCRT